MAVAIASESVITWEFIVEMNLSLFAMQSDSEYGSLNSQTFKAFLMVYTVPHPTNVYYCRPQSASSHSLHKTITVTRYVSQPHHACGRPISQALETLIIRQLDESGLKQEKYSVVLSALAKLIHRHASKESKG